MKGIFKHIIGSILAKRAHQFLKKNKVKVIAVTGSVGKTSTKEAIYTVLKSKFEVTRSQKSFNTPMGMSLAILGESESGFSSILAWAKILKRALFNKRKPPKIMVLEMGADKPGDIQTLMDIAPPSISVITAVKEVHLGEGHFKNIEAITQEKGTLVRSLSPSNLAILNGDDARVQVMKTDAKKVLYGHDSAHDLRVMDVKSTPQKLHFKVSHKGESARFEAPVIGEFQIYVCLPAIAVGLSLGMSLQECSQALASFALPPGRMNPIEGINSSHILDGSYNASPSTVEASLKMLQSFDARRKIAALGTMNELGELSHEAHIQAGQHAATISDLLIVVGPEAETLKKGAQEAGFPDKNIHTFVDSDDAGDFLAHQLEEGDLVLVKGSQNQVRMEKLVKKIMQNPAQASELLCRQGSAWVKK